MVDGVVDIMGNFGYNRFKAEDFGLEPNVTGFEEEINLAYLDGEREGSNKTNLKMLVISSS